MIYVENGSLQTAVDSAIVGDVVMLTENITLTSRLKVSNVVTIDLNGYSITADINDSYGAIYVGTNGVLTIKDSSIAQSGSIINTMSHAIGNYGTVNIYGGTITGDYALYNFYYNGSVYGTAVIYGGLLQSVDETVCAIANCGDLTLSGGTIKSVDTTNMLSVTGGNVESLYIGVADYNPEQQSTSISGGNILSLSVADNNDNQIAISGGNFACEVNSKYLVDGYKLTYNENTGTYGVLSDGKLKVIATSSSRVKDLVIKDGQLIFIQDKGRIAFDFKGKRKFYNQITELATDQERSALLDPDDGYYFIIETAVLWAYHGEWSQITAKPDEIVFIDTELPALGKAQTLYVDKDDKEISIWDEEAQEYIVVSDYTNEITTDDIDALFA